MNRIDRLIAVLTTLQSKRVITVTDISEKYKISERTVYRDLKALGEIGVPITFDDQKGYSILQGFFLPPISLTPEEANSLILISTLSEKFSDSTTKSHVENAIEKIKAVLKNRDQQRVEHLHSQIKIYNPHKEATSHDYLTEIQNSIVEKISLQITYINNDGEVSNRKVEPIGLTFYSNQWHLIAWCWKRLAYRDFKVRSITSLCLGESFKKPDHVDINDYIKSLT